jgi:hypothetical protein
MFCIVYVLCTMVTLPAWWRLGLLAKTVIQLHRHLCLPAGRDPYVANPCSVLQVQWLDICKHR